LVTAASGLSSSSTTTTSTSRPFILRRILDRKREAVADLLAECRRGPDKVTITPTLTFSVRGRIGGEPKQNRQAGQLQLLFHDFFLIGRLSAAKSVYPTSNFRA